MDRLFGKTGYRARLQRGRIAESGQVAGVGSNRAAAGAAIAQSPRQRQVAAAAVAAAIACALALCAALLFAAPAYAKEAVEATDTGTGLAAGTVDQTDSDGADNNQADSDQASDSGQASSSSAATKTKVQKPKLYTGKGTFYIVASTNKKRAVGMKNDIRTNDAKLALANRKATNLLRFKLVKAPKKGYYYIQNVATGRMLSAVETDSGKYQVVMRFNYSKSYQRWKVERNADKTFTFTNAKTKQRLNIAGSKAKKGARLILRAASDTKAQKFKLVKTNRNKNEVVKIDVPCYMQNPQLPTGCESVALTNALNYWGCKLSKTTIANSWMPYGSDGVYNFIGNPRDASGWIICAPGIANTGNRYLRYRDMQITAEVKHGATLKSLRHYLDKGYPVIVWTTIGMGSPNFTGVHKHGYTLNGNNHAVVLSGYNPKNGGYYVADSLAGKKWRSGGRFTWLYNVMGKQAVVLHD